MMRSLVDKYRLGMITDDQLVVESLNKLDPDNPGQVLSCLPDPILHRMLQFAKQDRSSSLVTNYGVLPAKDQIQAARDWIEKSRQQKTTKTV